MFPEDRPGLRESLRLTPVAPEADIVGRYIVAPGSSWVTAQVGQGHKRVSSILGRSVAGSQASTSAMR